MKNFKPLILLILLTSTMYARSGFALEQGDIEQFNSLWSSSFKQAETLRLASLYAQDAVMFPPSSEILEGRNAIENYFASLKRVGFEEYSISLIDVDLKENTAYETATWEATRIDEAGNAITMEGNITNIFERQTDGSWKIKMQSWN